jgi:transcriptional regulator with XRE-family HTH domain
MIRLAQKLDFGITDSAIEKWERNQNQPTESYRVRIVEFLGFDPATQQNAVLY